jgi:hypothetical protein
MMHRYHSEVLVLEPWEEIYVVDEERTMSFADTVEFQELLIDAFERSGYTLVEVPRVSLENRAAFVRDCITRRSDQQEESGGGYVRDLGSSARRFRPSSDASRSRWFETKR